MSADTEFPHQVAQMKKMLGNLRGWIEEACAVAAEKKYEPDVLCGLRLAPDQFALVRQVQSACDSAKLAAARITGVQAPHHPDDEKTMDELAARIESTCEFLAGLEDAAFAGAAEREVRLPFLPGKATKGADYFREFALPNFYFHVVSAYSILRANGVPLGKMKYIGSMPLYDVET